MPAKYRDLRKASGYLPVALFEKLEKRAERNYNSISRELVQILAKVLEEEQEQPKVAAQ